ncbi:PssE/Cps14G family polysaccharide biosynthesis glycosyltransferase [Photobacterium leiognathi]|uniref:PssE/Cps14G family polysaccharide biosynthesis glycosyltransferase n=1 Tax=Photobacterium leiognathi TaxID=553611 RepID=UPI002981F97C|nr:PssE/Cps14G family polysaccharide biosynthesis glycosyltransferase [Photobacterium leiognathi]
MNILVTVGTGSFDTLISSLEEKFRNSVDIKLTIQYGSGNRPSASNSIHDMFDFKKNIDELFYEFDLVICHCGAGTVFSLLEKNIPFIAVPNLERVDKHQVELAKYLDEMSYSIVCFDVNDISNSILNYKTENIKKYQKTLFFMADDILDYLL